MKNLVLTSGELPCSLEEAVNFPKVHEIVGKTIAAVGWCNVDSNYGEEPATVLFFKDNTLALYVHPSD